MKLLQSVSLFLSLCLFSSCFEIDEYISLTEKGSGNYKQVINLKEAYSAMEMLASMDTSNKKGPAMTSVLSWENIKKVKGIRNLRIDSVDHVYTWSFDFDNIQSLNNAISSIYNGNQETVEYYSFDGSTFKKNFTGFESITETSPEESEMTLSFFKDARVDLNVTFDKKIRSINQSMAIKKDKSFSISTNFEAIVNENSLKLEVKLK
mgnify:FL=1